ncbi:hypothetical protein H8L32_25945 [Undibacterium sp. CY18W]|uniref:Cytochrome c oxidase cbb3-type subunit 4 n=1 Tax=Undibacterium hunanense TaxID=2762292 RepID=A0ABR6ZYW0_9BURK|nr:hypothetical protein [Undibacterium hunanense]MBC3920934.1 hypothetical protein [Undibacterium hunanense]
MWLLALEAGVAMFILIFIVWWTMFQGRAPETPPKEDKKPVEQTQDSDNPQ